MNEIMYLTNRNRGVIHIYNGKSVTKVYSDRPRIRSILKYSCFNFSCFFFFFCVCVFLRQKQTFQIVQKSTDFCFPLQMHVGDQS